MTQTLMQTNLNVIQLVRQHVLLLLGFMSLVIPTIIQLDTELWGAVDQEHGPILLAIFGWILWREVPGILVFPPRSAQSGWFFIVAALLLYVVCHSQKILPAEVFSFLLLAIGWILLYRGWAGVYKFKFPLIFMLFLIPLPGVLVDALTNGLKQGISTVAEQMLYYLNYPVARSGVTLTVGNYQLLVADACSGLNSLYSLFALGILYLYLQRYKSLPHNLVLLLLIPPVAILANILRVMVLVLVTYHFGAEAGQGFIHGAAGIFLFFIALVTLYCIDAVLILSIFKRETRR